MRDTIAPVKNATYNARKQLGQPKKRPIKNESFISPFPIPLFLVIKYKNKKNPALPSAESKELTKKNGFKKIKNKKELIIKGNTRKSGIISCHKSIKKMHKRQEKTKI
ncbi:MAG TPA: hypothetical protein VF820_04995 [Patescibacteria group bacterium]